MRARATRLVAACGCVLLLGCESITDVDEPEISNAEAAIVAAELEGLLFAAFAASMNGEASASGANLVYGDPFQVNIQLPHTPQPCPVKGRQAAGGSITGSLDDETGDGVLSVQILMTMTECTFILNNGEEAEVNGDPYMSLAGFLTIRGGEFTPTSHLRLGGAFTVRNGPTCRFNRTFYVGDAEWRGTTDCS